MDKTAAWYTCRRRLEGETAETAGYLQPRNYPGGAYPGNARGENISIRTTAAENTTAWVLYRYYSCVGWSGGEIADGKWTGESKVLQFAIGAHEGDKKWIEGLYIHKGGGDYKLPPPSICP